jgi:ketosteroid isomerase-like protein
MSQQNMEIVRSAFDGFAEGGIEAVLEYAAADSAWHTAPEFLEGSQYAGHDGLRYLLSVWVDNFDDWTMDVIELRDAGEGSVVALIEHGGKIKGTEVPVRQPMGCVYSDFRHGQIGSGHFFQTWQEALEAAGLSE